MEELMMLEYQQVVMGILATLILGFVCTKRKDLIKWLFAYVSTTVGVILTRFQIIDEIFDIIGTVFLVLSSIMIFVAALKDYKETFTPEKKVIPSHLSIVITLFIMDFLLNSFEIAIALLLIISSFLLLRVFLVKRTPTHVFLTITVIAAILSIITSIFERRPIAGAYEFSEGIDNIFFTVMLLTGIVALIEDRLLKSEIGYARVYNRAEFYKDLFLHDINNILQNIQMSLEVFSQYLKDPSMYKNIEEILYNAKHQVIRGATLNSNIRLLSDLNEGKIKRHKIEICEILRNSIQQIRKTFEREQIEIEIRSPKEKIYVYGNKLFSNMFEILIHNAIKYNESEVKRITIKISFKDKKFIKIQFIDNGKGIPDVMKETIFQRFIYPRKNSTRIGLGLLFVRELIEYVHGDIWVEDRVPNDPTKGSKFALLIPLKNQV